MADVTEIDYTPDETNLLIGGQKYMIYSIILNFISNAVGRSQGLDSSSYWIVTLIAAGLSLLGVYLVSTCFRYPMWHRVILMAIMFVPLVNLIALLVLNHRATKALRSEGYKVGLLGAKE